MAQAIADAKGSRRKQRKRIQRLRCACTGKQHRSSRCDGYGAAYATPCSPYEAENGRQQRKYGIQIDTEYGHEAEKGAEENLLPGRFQLRFQPTAPIFIDIPYYIALAANWQILQKNGAKAERKKRTLPFCNGKRKRRLNKGGKDGAPPPTQQKNAVLWMRHFGA